MHSFHIKPLAIALAIAFQVVLSACSVQFAQLDSIRLMLRLNEKPLDDVKWSVLWNGEYSILYVTNTEFESTFLSGSDVRLYFRDFHFTEIVGLLPDGQRVLIEKDGGDVVFSINDLEVARDFCEEWQVFEAPQNLLEAGTVRYAQSCYRMHGQDGRLEYQNEIDVDPSMRMSRLKFLIHPDHDSIVLTLSI